MGPRRGVGQRPDRPLVMLAVVAVAIAIVVVVAVAAAIAVAVAAVSDRLDGLGRRRVGLGAAQLAASHPRIKIV